MKAHIPSRDNRHRSGVLHKSGFFTQFCARHRKHKSRAPATDNCQIIFQFMVSWTAFLIMVSWTAFYFVSVRVSAQFTRCEGAEASPTSSKTIAKCNGAMPRGQSFKKSLLTQNSTGQLPRHVPISNNRNAIDEHIVYTDGRLHRVRPCRPVRDSLRIEDNDIGGKPLTDSPAVGESKTLRWKTAHFIDGFFQ